MPSLLLVDSSHIVRKVGTKLFSSFGFTVYEASNIYEARKLCEKESLPDYLIIDEFMEDALEFITCIRKMPLGINVFIYYLLIEVDFDKMIAGARAGVNSFLLKPFNREAIQFAMRDLPQINQLKDGNNLSNSI
ncbi:putative two-component response regulator protein [Candidatus Liberibacter solanacearum]|uniref:Probable two-component response regulator protein n=1 Tax=Liberibacter solanacearum (strain CLso-ZC1) TaxID=658172 RepID=E4UDL4_LIBSC|nr:response regulator [Candidatus Liberibacter solanacearum]ADR52692.1 probable two-component response regulator protein [Candidatus Liberibacter solanacearum CLso-ZC1]